MSDDNVGSIGPLTEAEVELLVERVCERVMVNFYSQIGKSVVNKMFWLVGVIAVSIAIWLAGAGKLKIGT